MGRSCQCCVGDAYSTVAAVRATPSSTPLATPLAVSREYPSVAVIDELFLPVSVSDEHLIMKSKRECVSIVEEIVPISPSVSVSEPSVSVSEKIARQFAVEQAAVLRNKAKPFNFVDLNEILLQRVGNVSEADLREFQEAYSNHPLDPDYKGKQTRAASLRVSKQTGEITRYASAFLNLTKEDTSDSKVAGRRREFANQPADWQDKPVAKALLQGVSQLFFELNPSYKSMEATVFSDRVVDGKPSPEGVHQDGCLLAATVLVNRINVKEGTGRSRIWTLNQPSGPYTDAEKEKNNGNLLAERTLMKPFEGVLFQDRLIKHEGSSFEPEVEGEFKTRDMLIFFCRGGDDGPSSEPFMEPDVAHIRQTKLDCKLFSFEPSPVLLGRTRARSCKPESSQPLIASAHCRRG
jgi:hypothetical protein